MTYNTNLNRASEYPVNPGWRNPETSRATAIAITPQAKGLQRRILNWLQEHKDGAYSSEEIATVFGLQPHEIYPRISTLLAQKAVEDSKLRTKNEGGHNVIMWKAV